MYLYKTLFRRFHIDPRLEALATGDQPLPTMRFEAAGVSSSYPPAFWPVWDSGTALVGLWVHWFCERQPVFVDLPREYPEVCEIARSFEQFSAWAVARFWVTAFDEEEKAQVRDLATYLGLTDADDIIRASTDDDFKLAKMAPFANDPARGTVDPSKYVGDFPLIPPYVGRTPLTKACGFEVPPDAVRGLADAPNWLQDDADQPRIFRDRLNAGDLSAAWLCLNSPGWMFSEVRSALGELSRLANDPDFDLLVQAWSAAGHPDDEGY